ALRWVRYAATAAVLLVATTVGLIIGVTLWSPPRLDEGLASGRRREPAWTTPGKDGRSDGALKEGLKRNEAVALKGATAKPGPPRPVGEGPEGAGTAAAPGGDDGYSRFGKMREAAANAEGRAGEGGALRTVTPPEGESASSVLVRDVPEVAAVLEHAEAGNEVIFTDRLDVTTLEVENVLRSNGLAPVAVAEPGPAAKEAAQPLARANIYQENRLSAGQIQYEAWIAPEQVPLVQQQLDGLRARQNVSQRFAIAAGGRDRRSGAEAKGDGDARDAEQLARLKGEKALGLALNQPADTDAAGALSQTVREDHGIVAGAQVAAQPAPKAGESLVGDIVRSQAKAEMKDKAAAVPPTPTAPTVPPPAPTPAFEGPSLEKDHAKEAPRKQDLLAEQERLALGDRPGAKALGRGTETDRGSSTPAPSAKPTASSTPEPTPEPMLPALSPVAKPAPAPARRPQPAPPAVAQSRGATGGGAGKREVLETAGLKDAKEAPDQAVPRRPAGPAGAPAAEAAQREVPRTDGRGLGEEAAEQIAVVTIVNGQVEAERDPGRAARKLVVTGQFGGEGESARDASAALVPLTLPATPATSPADARQHELAGRRGQVQQKAAQQADEFLFSDGKHLEAAQAQGASQSQRQARARLQRLLITINYRAPGAESRAAARQTEK
ncbi:MAG TPA: hypothetical protein VM695_13590, partial [Phycisphaerae bacterium]|nr:hypothetical protein [Phycisphaerae bacterium]